MARLLFDEAVAQLSQAPGGYCPEAYQIIHSALNHTLTNLGVPTGKERHVTGREFCEGLRDYALMEYGPIAATVLQSWGILTTADVGKIVFQLIEIGFYRKSPHDRLEDFTDVFDFQTALRAPFLPKSQAPAVGSR